MNWLPICLIFVLANAFFQSKEGSTPCESDLRNCSIIMPGVFDCSRRMFLSIPCFPIGTTSVDLSHNRVHTFGRALAGLRSLRVFIIANNNIEDIIESALDDLFSLEYLDLSCNNLNENSFPNHIFASLNNMRILYLQNNTYSRYPADVFTDILSLTTLHIDVFEDFEFDEDFLGLKNLSKVEFYPRNNFHLRNSSFYGLSNSPILYLNLPFEYVILLPISVNVLSPFRYLRGVKISVRLSGDLKDALSMLHGLRGLNMEYIDLSHNPKSISVPINLQRKDLISLEEICVRKVDLTANDIGQFPFELLFGTPFANCLETFLIGDNSLQSGNFIPLLQYLFYPNITVIDISYMGQGQEKNYPDKKGFNIFNDKGFNASQTKTKFTLRLSESLEEFRGSHTFMHDGHLPPPIHFVVEAPGLQYLDLSYTGITLSRPGFMITCITNLKVLDISGWSCSEMNLNFLSTFPTLETLIFSNAMLGSGLRNDTDGELLMGLHLLSTIDLSVNNLQHLHENFFINQSYTMINITLDDNDFDHIPECISHVQNLKVLSLKGNRISSLSSVDISILTKFDQLSLHLSGNRFVCECTALKSLQWMRINAHKIPDFSTLLCTDDTLVSNVTHDMHQFELHCISSYWLKFAITLLALSVVLLVTGALTLRYRVTLEYLYLRMRMHVHRSKPRIQSDGYTFDAFISYSHHDTNWVVNVLYRQLTESLKQNICIHDKDFRVGHWISDEIVRCIDESRHVVFVVTNHFLESDWSTYELEMARIHSFRSSRTGLIIIMRDSIPLQKMPNALKKIWWKVVCLEWPNDSSSESEELFWSKLRLAIQT